MILLAAAVRLHRAWALWRFRRTDGSPEKT